jgi:hypothetical protein
MLTRCLNKLLGFPLTLWQTFLNSSLGIPTFSSHEEHRKHILIHTAAVFRDFSRKGFTEGMSGHISVRDPEFEDYIWMNPLGKHFGLMTAGDLICLDIKTGKQVGGNRVRTTIFFVGVLLIISNRANQETQQDFSSIQKSTRRDQMSMLFAMRIPMLEELGLPLLLDLIC